MAYPEPFLNRTVALSLLALLVPAAAARAAGDPIMPLAQVTPGMQCTGYSVVRGTTISSFSVDIIDVLADNGGEGPRILFSVSGPAVDQTGIGPGFSGSPIYCPGPDGVMENAGAISEGIGQYGNNIGLATPIEQILGEPVSPPSSMHRDSALLRSARPLSEPLSISGLSTPLVSALQRAALSVGRTVYASPSAPRDVTTFPVQTLVPGASVAAGYSSGAIAAGAIGTVAYVDGNQLWAFGHDLAGAGRRDLFLQDAYVYTVVNNPLGTSDTSSYKLAAPGHVVGTLTDDAPNAIAGTLGTMPTSFPLDVTARDLDANTTTTLNTQVADESALGNPEGQSALSLVGPAAVAQAAFDVLNGSPATQSGSMCVSIRISESRAPMRFCNDYVGGSPGENGIAASPMVADMAAAVGDLDAYELTAVHITAVNVTISLRRELHQAFMLHARAPKVVRRGQTVAVKIALRIPRGAALTRTIKVKVPRNERIGRRDIVLTGTPADVVGPAPSTSDVTIDLGLSSGDSSEDTGPTSIDGLRAEIAAIHRQTGVNATLRAAGVDHGAIGPQVLAGTPLRLTGNLNVPVIVRR
jgi:hypothetical protein